MTDATSPTSGSALLRSTKRMEKFTLKASARSAVTPLGQKSQSPKRANQAMQRIGLRPAADRPNR